MLNKIYKIEERYVEKKPNLTEYGYRNAGECRKYCESYHVLSTFNMTGLANITSAWQKIIIMAQEKKSNPL